MGEPQTLPFKWSKKRYVAVFATISVENGCVLRMYKVGEAFKSPDIDEFLERLRSRMGPHKKIAVFWDNASIHKSPAKDALQKHKIEVVWNAAYRPDLNGIEFFWGRLKQAYRKEITRLRSQNLHWD